MRCAKNWSRQIIATLVTPEMIDMLFQTFMVKPIYRFLRKLQALLLTFGFVGDFVLHVSLTCTDFIFFCGAYRFQSPCFGKKKYIGISESNSSPLKIGRAPKGNSIFQPSVFRNKLAVSFREDMCFFSCVPYLS